MKTKLVSSNTQTPPSISDAEVQECLSHLDAVATVLAPYLVTLTAPQRTALGKGRKQVEPVIPQLAKLASRFGIANASVNVDQMVQAAALAEALQPVIGRTRTLLEGLGDTVLQARSNACHTAVTVHTFLKRLSSKNGSLKGELSVVSGAFARKSRAAKADTVTEPTETAITPATGATAPAPAVVAAKAS